MTTPAVSPHVTELATKLVLELLPGRCPQWRQEQLMHEATTTMGMTGDKALIRELLQAATKRRGKHEYEVEAVEDVLIKHYRMRNWS